MRKFMVTINVNGKFYKFKMTGHRESILDSTYDIFGACGITLIPA